ncbi:hypothetical protein INR49_001459 [Caranx melampygus]|nr:hypothetical protein INR49_001459 [Caranx melampygus]
MSWHRCCILGYGHGGRGGVVWNEVMISERKNFKLLEEKVKAVFDNLIHLEHANIVKFHKYWADTKETGPGAPDIMQPIVNQARKCSKKMYAPTAWKRWCTQILSALRLHNGLIKIGSVAPDTINNHVKTCHEEQKNMHFFAPEYGDIYSFGMCALEMALLEIQGNGESSYVSQEAINNEIRCWRTHCRGSASTVIPVHGPQPESCYMIAENALEEITKNLDPNLVIAETKEDVQLKGDAQELAGELVQLGLISELRIFSQSKGNISRRREMCTFDKDKGPGRLMKNGLTLILVGHINFILGAIVHGSVLRHISKPDQHITTEYTIANIISVTSGLLSIVTGITAIVMSRNLHVLKLQIGLLIASFLNALLSAACCTGVLLAISVTVAHNGQGLMQGCNDTQVPIDARSPISAQCPFDTTRIYDTTLALWVPCSVLAGVETGLSVWCFVTGLALRGLAPCGNRYIKEQLEGKAEGCPHSRRLIGKRVNFDA